MPKKMWHRNHLLPLSDAVRIPEAVQTSPEKLTLAGTRSKGTKLRETDGSDEAGDEYEYSEDLNSRSLLENGDLGLVNDVVSLPAELWMEEEDEEAEVRPEAIDTKKPTRDLRDFLEDALSSLEKLELQWTLESEVQGSLVDINTPISEEDKVEDSTKQEEDLGPMRLRRRVHPPQRLTTRWVKVLKSQSPWLVDLTQKFYHLLLIG